MRALDTKLSRDLRRLWAQALAIALVIAGGVATIVLAVGSMRSLDETRIAYYERYRFADVFATVTRAPKTLVDRIAEIPGVSAVDVRVAKLALLDIPDLREPATGLVISAPETSEPALNRLFVRAGRLPEPGRANEVVINEGLAVAHGLRPGSRFSAILNGRRTEMAVVGTALSPEFVYAVGPGDIMPDERRFGIIWMGETALASAYNLNGAFTSVSLQLLRSASERDVIAQLDRLLEPYGGTAAYARKDQTSHAFLEHGLDMLRNMSSTLPPIFLLVSAFLVNLTLSRLVTLEREQIGLLKALGYSNAAVATHYVKFVVLIAAGGIAIGGVAGTWLGSYVTTLFGDYYRFPFLVYALSPDIYVMAAVLSLAAAVAGAARALREVVRLPPAVAMRPPAPQRFRHILPAWFALDRMLPPQTIMTLRNMARHPVRVTLTALGMAFATGILVVSLFLGGAMEQLIDVTYFMSDRQDATISFVGERPREVAMQVARLPGVLAVEPIRQVAVRIRNANVERRVSISGRPRDADLNRIVDTDLRPVRLPERGLALSAHLARILGVRVGDVVEVDLLEGVKRTVSLPVAALVEDYLGIRGMMDADSLARLLREAPAANSVSVSLDANALDLAYDAIKRLPTVAGMALQSVSLVKFREALAVIVTTMAGIYTGLAATIAFGVVYNSARISLSERGRELASLRVLGFTPAEVFQILALELMLTALIAQPPGWAIGYGLAWIMNTQLGGELMRTPMVMENLTYVLATAIVIAATLLSALVVRQRVNHLDLVAVLKTRE
ncbi:MAG: FtsX-like permease family protein [Bauldia sp.]